MATATEEKKSVTVRPFAIEADHPRNCDLLIQSIPACRLRGAIKAARTVTNSKTGQVVIPVDQSRHLGTFPEVPGMQLHVNPEKLTYVVLDPLADDDELCARITRGLRQSSPIRTDEKIKGKPPLKGTLDVHRMKTLCREMRNIVEAGEAKVVVGTMPDLADIDELPGNYLLNPGSIVTNQQPQFEKDFEKWQEQLVRAGG